MEYFGYDIASDAMCEICSIPANDVHHIDGRGKGKDVIENLMGLCRTHHSFAHAHVYTKERLRDMHLKFMQENRVLTKNN